MSSLRTIAAVCLAASAIDPLIEHLSTLVEADPRPGSKAHYRLRQVYDIITSQAVASALATASTSSITDTTLGHSSSAPHYHSSTTTSCSSTRPCAPASTSTSDMSLAVNAHLLGQLTAMMTAMRSCRSVSGGVEPGMAESS